MNCKICGKEINSEHDIHYLEEYLVCTDCYEHEQEETIE